MANDYIINWSNGTLKAPFTLAGNSQNTTQTSLVLTGKGSSNWGEPLQENQLKLLEHFASDVAPANPTYGQLWYDSTQLTLRIYQQTPQITWFPIYSLSAISRTVAPATPADGQLWYDTTVDVLNHWNGSEWIPIYSSSSLTAEVAPSSPKIGQLWYKGSINTLHVYNGTVWVVIFSGNSISAAAAPSSPVRGQLWFDTVNNILKIYDNTNTFVPISSSSLSITGDLNMNSYKIINLADGVSGAHAINKNQLDAAITGVQGSITTINTNLTELKVYKIYQQPPSLGTSGNGWTGSTFSGIGGPSSWPAGFSGIFWSYEGTTYHTTGAISVTGPVGKNWRFHVVYHGYVTYVSQAFNFNIGVKALVDGAVSGSGNWTVAGDVGIMGSGGDHGVAMSQPSAALSTSSTYYSSTSQQTYTGTHTIEIRTIPVCKVNPGAVTYIAAGFVEVIIMVD